MTKQTLETMAAQAIAETRDVFARNGVRLEHLHPKLQDLVGACFIRGRCVQVKDEMETVRSLRTSLR